MAEVTLESAPQKARDLFNKGFAAFERGSLDYAVDLLSTSLQICPELLQARRFLRAAEIKRFKDQGGGHFTHVMSTLRALPAYAKAFQLIRARKGAEALRATDALLKLDPLNVRFIRLFGIASELAGLPEAGVQMLEIARDHYPSHVALMKQLGKLYGAAGSTREARLCFEKLAELLPSDPEVRKSLKDMTALDSMRSDGWNTTAETGGTYREMIRDTKQAELLEQKAKSMRSERDSDSLIAESLAKIEAEPENVNYYRSLARLYIQKKMFPEALQTLARAMELVPGDPELTASISRARTQQFDHDIARLREAGDEPAAAALETERDAFVFDDLRTRVDRYPNDLALRFDLGAVYFERDMVMEAIQQFQLAQRSPQHRIQALFNLGLCFKQKKQYDLALEQFEKAASEVTGMDDDMKDICYELGTVSELLGKPEKALGYFKRIYQMDIGFRDVAQKIESAYR